IQGIESLKDQAKEQRKALREFRRQETDKHTDEILEGAKVLAGQLKLFAFRLDHLSIDELRRLSDTVRSKSEGPTGLILLSVEEGHVNIVTAFDDQFQAKGVRAGDICREIGKAMGGGGGGKPNMAQGQGKNPEQADQALAQAVKGIEELVGPL
ncbi:MAG: hypothetical protein KJ645_01610, partial [Planctomycetes bacterium]|nr:hypothetical protein [Planctomycetota bacterium]